MAQPQEPLYDFPEPAPLLERKFLGHQRGRGSLKSINVLDRLLLTVPVWLQLSINPATALHILQREPPGVRYKYALHIKKITVHHFGCVHNLMCTHPYSPPTHTHNVSVSCRLFPCPTHLRSVI